MSIESIAQVLHHSRAAGNTLAVLIGIANHEGDGGSYPKVETLARYGRMNVRNTQKAIARLVAMGEVVVYRQDGGGRNLPDHLRPNRYVTRVPCPAWCDRTSHHRDTRDRADRVEVLTGPTLADLDPDDLSTVLSPTCGVGGVAGDTPPPVGGVAGDTPPPVASDTPEPSLGTNPPTPPHDTRPCLDCGQDQARCQAPQVHWPQDDRHPYRPSPTLHAVASRPPAAQVRRSRRA